MTTTPAVAPLSPADAAIIEKQVADWRREVARLQDLIAHATTTPQSQVATYTAGIDLPEKTWKDAPYKMDHVGEAWARGWNEARASLAQQAAAPVGDAEDARAIQFALELAEHENDDAAVSFLKAWSNEDAAYLHANWPDFRAAMSSSQKEPQS